MKDCVRCKSPQIPVGNVIFLFTYYFVTFFSNLLLSGAPQNALNTFVPPPPPHLHPPMGFICFKMFPWNFFVKSGGREGYSVWNLEIYFTCGNRMYYFVGAECIIGEEGFHFKPALSVRLSLVCAAVETCYADLRASFFSAVLRVTCGKHPGRGSVEEGKVNVLHSGEDTVSRGGCLSCVCITRGSSDTIRRAFCKCVYWMRFWLLLLVIYRPSQSLGL